MTILIHEDFVNHILNRLSLGGREVPDRLIDHMMQMLLDVLARKSLKGMSFDLSNRVDSEFRVEPEFATLLLDQDRPLSIQFGEGQAVLTLRSGFQTLLGREMPTQRVKIPFRVSTGEQQVTLEPGEVTVSPMSADDGPLIGLARPVIRQQVEQRLQSMAVARTVPLAIPGMVPTTLTVRDVVLQDGWLAITFD